MFVTVLHTLFERDLAKLSLEIDAYQHEPALWRTAPGISNSAGNLCLHLLGNLNTYIGAGLAHTGYVRNRDWEFAAPYVPRAELLAGIAATRGVVADALAGLTDAHLATDYPLLVGGAHLRGLLAAAFDDSPGLSPGADQLPPPLTGSSGAVASPIGRHAS
jgi:hypothetical protein